MTAACGWLVIDKPLGMTSRAAVDRAARWFAPKTAIGHTGTLDPLATGILVLGIGKATRLTEYVQEMGKIYTATFTLGATSETDDGEGPIQAVAAAADPGQVTVETALNEFVGTIEQTPPSYSAARIGGRRAYAKARAGTPDLPNPKLVRIDSISVLGYRYPELRLEVRCGKGTYIRSLARDLGARLGVGGYVSTLHRECVGTFDSHEATALDAPTATPLPLSRGVASLPRVTLEQSDLLRLLQGQTIPCIGLRAGQVTACFDPSDSLKAVGIGLSENLLQPIKVLSCPSHRQCNRNNPYN